MIIDHTDPDYQKRLLGLGKEKYNGAYYYSKEIVEQIIPNIKTDRNWVTVSTGKPVPNHSIVFIHSNINPFQYRYLLKSYDLVLVFGTRQTTKTMRRYGDPIYLPLSVDVDYVKQFVAPKTRKVAFAGRPKKDRRIPKGVDKLKGLPREELLAEMAKYEQIYAVGRTAIEARILGCEILPYDRRFPNPEVWKVVDTKEATAILQEKLEELDGGI